MIFEAADFVESEEQPSLPRIRPQWGPVTLPDDWRRLGHNKQRTQGWYRIRFALPEVPPRPGAIYDPGSC